MNFADYDQAIFNAINHSFHSPVLDVFMALLSSWAFWRPFVLLAAAFVVVLGRFKERAFVCCAVFSILIADPGVANSIKQIVNRPRPYQAMAGVRVVRLHKTQPRFLAVAYPAVVTRSRLPSKKGENRSFPSGHVTNNAVIATLLTWFYVRRGWLYFIVAALVAWSRVYVGDHYPLDVLGALVIGASVALLAMMFLEFIWRRVGPKLSPALASAYPTLVSQ